MMMKRQLITGTLIMLVSLGGPAVKADSSQQAARYEAREAVKNLQPIDEDALANHDDEYIDAYLTEYEQDTAEYASSFNQGINGEYYQPDNEAAETSDNQGYSQTKQVEKGTGELVSNGQATDSKIDDRIYPPQAPLDFQVKFINRIAKAAQKVGREYDLYPSVIIAQAALESDWGRSSLGSAPYNNLFGVKGYFAAHTVTQPTIEYDRHGNKFEIFSNFRRYKDEYDSLKDYAETLKAPLYNGVHRKKATNYRAATRALLGRYATDPGYDQKLNKLIDTYQLTKYDTDCRNNQAVKVLPIPNKNAGIKSEPLVSKRPVKAKEKDNDLPRYLSIFGGLGTAGIIELWYKLK